VTYIDEFSLDKMRVLILLLVYFLINLI